jgi:hypothetical protein
LGLPETSSMKVSKWVRLVPKHLFWFLVDTGTSRAVNLRSAEARISYVRLSVTL